MNRIAILLLGWLFFFNVSCKSFYLRLRDIPKTSTIAAETKVPLHFKSFSPAIDVTINGKGPYRLILASNSLSIIGSDLADELALKPGSEKGSNVIVSQGGIDSITYKKIESLRIGPNEFREFDCIRSTQPFFNHPNIVGTYGTLGLGVFSNALIILNYQNKTLTIKDEYLSPEDEDVMPITQSFLERQIFLEGTLNGNKQRFILAPGSDSGLYLDETTKQNVKYLKSPKPFEVKPSPTGLSTAYRGQMDGYIEIGKHKIENPMVYTSFMETTVISKGAYYETPQLEEQYPSIGGLLLKHFELAIDQRSQLIRLRRLHPDPIQLQ